MQKVLIVEDDTIQLNMLYQTIHDAILHGIFFVFPIMQRQTV